MPYYIKRKKEKKKDKPLPLFDKAGVTVKKKPDLKAKLDKEFSLYIRLRDSKPFNYRFFKCISCGEIKPFEKGDCGHFWSSVKQKDVGRKIRHSFGISEI